MGIMSALQSMFLALPGVSQKRNALHIPHNGQRNYPAGDNSHLRATWTNAPVSANNTIHRQLETLRARSREQYKASDYVRRYVSLCKTNIVGSRGIRFQSLAQGADGRPNVELARAVEREVNDWLRNGVDYYQELSWRAFLNLVVSTVAIDGEAFVRIRTGGRVNQWGMALQIIDPCLIDTRYNVNLANGNRVRFGVEYSPDWIVRAYHISGMSDSQTWGSYALQNAAGRIRVTKRNMIHLFDKEYPDQFRGFPWTSTALSRLHQLTAYDEAAIVNARYGASKMVFFKSPDGSQPQGDGYWPNGYKVTKVVPGSAEMLPEGVEPVAFDPTYPSQEYEPFTKRNIRGASSGLNVAYESLANDREGVNYSSIRTGVLEDRDVWQSKQQWLIDDFCSRVADRFFSIRSTAAGNIFSSPIAMADFDNITRHVWQPRTWPWVDPLKDVQASEAEIKMGTKSRSQHMRDAGRDPQETWAEIESEQQVMDDRGLGSELGETQ